MPELKIGSPPMPASAKAGAENAGKRGSLAAAGISGLLASLCCVGPLVLVSLGIGGAAAGILVQFSPLRPVFVGIALAALGFAAWRIFRRPAAACESGVVCTPLHARRYKIAFWIVAAFVLISVTSPYFLPLILE